MADDPGQAPNAPQDGQDPNADPNKPQDKPGTTDKPETFDRDYVEGLRREAADHRKKLRDAETRLKALEDEKLSDTEKKDKALAEALERAESAEKRVRQAEVRAAASAAGAVNPAAVARLIDDDAEDVEKAVQALKKSDPYLFTRPGAGSADGGAGGAAAKTQSANDVIRQMAGRR